MELLPADFEFPEIIVCFMKIKDKLAAIERGPKQLTERNLGQFSAGSKS